MNRVSLTSPRPPGSRSAANNSAPKSKTAQLQKVIQLQYGAVNWTAMNTYNSGSAGAEVSNAFNKANYTIDEIPKLVVGLINGSQHGKSRFGHMSGDDTGDGQQGDTTAKIEACKNFLITWANNHPKTSGAKISTGQKHSEEEQKANAKKKEADKQKKKKERQEQYERDNPYGRK